VTLPSSPSENIVGIDGLEKRKFNFLTNTIRSSEI